jgi:hypothetical protein
MGDRMFDDFHRRDDCGCHRDRDGHFRIGSGMRSDRDMDHRDRDMDHRDRDFRDFDRSDRSDFRRRRRREIFIFPRF